MSSFRICNRCKKELPGSEFYNPPSGMRYSCKRCDNAYSRLYNETHKEWKREYAYRYAKENPRRKWAMACLAGHRRRGYSTKITTRELYALALQTDTCYICGCKLDWQLLNKGRIKKDSPSLDRLDNDSVVRANNVAILCYSCNATKRDRTLNEFVAYCGSVIERFHSHFE